MRCVRFPREGPEGGRILGRSGNKLMGASARLRLVRLLGQDLPPLIFQPKEQIRLGMRSEFVGEFTEPWPAFWRGPGPASAEFKGAWALEDVSLWWVGMSSPALPTFLPALPAFSIWELWPENLICCLFNSSTGGASDSLLNFSHIG